MLTSEVCQTFGVSRQWLSVQRLGQTKILADGTAKPYPPKLKKGKHWKYIEWRVDYTDAGVERIKELIGRDKK